MKPQYQLRKEENGSCLQSCLATLLDLNQSHVPDFVLVQDKEGDAYPGYWRSVQDFLAGFGMALIEISLPANFPWQPLPHAALCIFFGETEKGIRHAVVGKAEDGELAMVFNPWPEAELKGISSIGVLVPRIPGDYMKMGGAMSKIERLARPSQLTGTYSVSETVAQSIHETALEALNRQDQPKITLNGHKRQA